jgi:tryptophan 2,3-dioxygenase
MDHQDDRDRRARYYADYLALEQLLALQRPLTAQAGRLGAHDEMLFIIVHQTYELWFKEILHEVQACLAVMRETIDDEGPALSLVVHRLKRTVDIWKLLNHQVDILETMTPLDFLDFRSSFHGASGFQSRQFREIEARLGLPMAQRYKGEYYKQTRSGGFDAQDYARITAVEHEATMVQCVNRWLERMPFLEPIFWRAADQDDTSLSATTPAQHPFWHDYRACYARSLSVHDQRAERLQDFDVVFFQQGLGQFTAQALRSALFIMLYRDEPLFRLPFQLLNALQEIDEQIGNFRYRHLQMVRRMIGLRVGTGGTSGAEYLEGAVSQNYIFKELSSIVTYMVERSRLPTLAEKVKKYLKTGF